MIRLTNRELMGTAHKTPYFFSPKPLFGLDIGVGTLKVVQLGSAPKRDQPPIVVGYGLTAFDAAAIADGVVSRPEVVAAAAQRLFRTRLVGDITTRRVALAIPAYRTFIRSIDLPPLKPSERAEAVKLEMEQYLPTSVDDMYLDYTTIAQTSASLQLLAVAVPRQVVDSYQALAALMGIEPVLIETTMNAIGRTFSRDQQSDVPSVLIDFGTTSSDISIYDGSIVTAGTVQGGGQVFSQVIQSALHVSGAEAQLIKTKYGLGVSRRQTEIQAALDPTLLKIVKEIKRLVRYYAERSGNKRAIGQVVAIGGGAYMPGLSDYLTSQLRIAVRVCDPWYYVDAAHLQLPPPAERSRYMTALGLAMAAPTEVFA